VERQISSEIEHPQWKALARSERFTNRTYSAEIDELTDELLSELSSLLSEISGTAYSIRFWDRFIRYWLISFIDTVFVEWLELAAQSERSPDPTYHRHVGTVNNRALKSMTDMLVMSQDPTWRNRLSTDIRQILINVDQLQPDSFIGDDFSADCIPNHTSLTRRDFWLGKFISQRSIVVVSTYLSRSFRTAVSLSCRTLPLRWKEPNLQRNHFSVSGRLRIAEGIVHADKKNFESVVRILLPAYIPMTVVELFPRFVTHFATPERTPPRVIYTDNQHFSSDSFAFWFALQGERGTRLVISQHGGLNGQGYFPTRDEEVEQKIADNYVHWGWSRLHHGVLAPAPLGTQFNKIPNLRKRTGILLVTDTTFRFRRKYWSDSEIYKNLVLQTYRSLPIDLQEITTVRLHRDHAKYDESHETFWLQEFPLVQLDSGNSSIRKLLRRKRLIICTTFGTTEIESFLRNIPTVLSLDPVIHQPRAEFRDHLILLESVGVVHFSEESLRNFLKINFASLEEWWNSESVQGAISLYLSKFGHQAQWRVLEYVKLLKDLARHKSR
jgi:putative transferase (TIGR04331 family)